MSKRGKPFKACKNCKTLVEREAEVCPTCGSKSFTDEWNGVIIILNPEKSDLAKKLDLKQKGKYVVKIG